jgi:hypothetical protein
MKRRSVAQIEGGGELKETLTVVWATGPHHVWGLAAAALGVWQYGGQAVQSGPPYNHGPVSPGQVGHARSQGGVATVMGQCWTMG